jgi:hypothetical protein
MLILMLPGGVSYSARMAAQDSTGIIADVGAGTVIGAGTGADADAGIGQKDFEYIKRADARLDGYNAAGIRYLPVDRISTAGIYANRGRGKFINYDHSDDRFTCGARTESFCRLSPATVFYGMVSYSDFTGKNMGGSAFIHPYDSPFDIVEYTDTTRGTKNLETYHLTGAVSTDITRRLTVGGKIDYTAANYAKQKDLRHKNRLLDMSVTAGVAYRAGSAVEIGANYYYRRSVEGVEFKTYGTTDRQYFSLISYGAFFGKTEMAGETGYTSEGEDNPMYDRFHGASLQLNVRFGREIALFNEVTYKRRDGEFGRRTPHKIVYSEHGADVFEYRGSLRFGGKGGNRHVVNLNLENERLENFENVYRSESRPGGYVYIVYYDPLKVAERERFGARAEYVAYLGVRDFCPRWTVGGSVEHDRRRVTASVYPYFRKQDIYRTGYRLSAARNVVTGKSMYGFSVDACYASGGGTAKEDGVYAVPGENQTKPRYVDGYLYREFEYLTAGQLSAGIGVRYSRRFDKPAVNGYTALYCNHTEAFQAGDGFTAVTLAVGCIF